MASPISAFGKRFLLGLRIPAAAPHVDMAVGPEGHAFVFQQDFLFGPGGNRPSLTVHHPVARQAGRCRSPMQRLSYHARAQRPASQRGDLPVGCDAAGRNSPHDVVYFSVKSFAIHRFRRPVRFVCRRNPLSLCVGARFPRCGYGVRSRPAHDEPHSSSGLRGCGGPFRKISVLYRRSVARRNILFRSHGRAGPYKPFPPMLEDCCCPAVCSKYFHRLSCGGTGAVMRTGLRRTGWTNSIERACSCLLYTSPSPRDP